MAGRLPGVGLLARKRAENNHRHENRHNYYLKEESLHPPSLPLTVLDQTALKARQRLHNKLGHFFSSYRYIPTFPTSSSLIKDSCDFIC